VYQEAQYRTAGPRSFCVLYWEPQYKQKQVVSKCRPFDDELDIERIESAELLTLMISHAQSILNILNSYRGSRYKQESLYHLPWVS
jgi:hypothetical protein